MKYRNRTQRTMGHRYDSPRGSIMSRVDTEYVETMMIHRDKIHSPQKELVKNNIMRGYKLSPKDSPRMIQFYKRICVHS